MTKQLPGVPSPSQQGHAMTIRRAQPLLAAIMAAFLLPLSLFGQTTINGKDLVHRSNGVVRPDGTSWRLDENGFLGTFITVAGSAPVAVTFTVSASKSSGDSGTPQLRLRVADFSQTWSVTDIGTSYGSHAQTWSLPPGTYPVRMEYINRASSLQLNIASLTVTGAAVVNAATDSNALAAADTYIANFRKGPATVTVTAAGQALANTQVRIRLKRHAFNFGTAVNGTSAWDTDWISGASTNAVNYRNFLNANFNTIVPENAGKWPQNEDTRDVVTMNIVDTMMDYAEAHDLRVRMHGVLWDYADPAWVDALQILAKNGDAAAAADLRGEITERIGYFVGGANGSTRSRRYIELDGINEDYQRSRLPGDGQFLTYSALYGTAGLAGIYNEIDSAMTAAGTSAKTYVNEFNVLQYSFDPDYANWYRVYVESLVNAGAGGSLAGIGIQYYPYYGLTGSNAHSPARMLQVFSNLGVTGLPLSLTEFGVIDLNAPTPQQAADMLSDTVRMVFGHPDMRTFMSWGFWKGSMVWAAEAAFVDAGWNLTIAGKTWQQMMGVHDWGLPNVPVWTTDVTLTTDASGQVSIPSGFYGDYEVTAPGGTGTLTLAKGTTTYSVPLAGSAATPNLLSNGGFESGSTGGWTTWAPTISATTAQAHSGSFSGLVSGRTAEWQGIVQDVPAVLTPGRTYDVSLWVRWESGAAAAPVTATLNYNDSAGGHWVLVASGANATSTGWTRITGSFTFSPTGTVTGASIYPQSDVANATRSFYVDDASLTVREAATSIQAAGGSPGAGAVRYNVNFALPVTGFSLSDVVVMHNGTSHTSVTVAGSSANYTVTLAGLSGTGSLSISVPSGAATAQGDGAASLGSGPAPRVFTLATTAGTGGQASANPLAGAYPAGASVSLTATPQTGYLFTGWSGSLTGSSNPATLNILDSSLAAASFSTNPAIYEGWSISKLGSIQSPTDDFDRDGVSNLLEYAMGMEPGTPDAQKVPTVGTAPGGRLQLTYRRNTLATDLTTYKVQGVSDLTGTWQPLVNPTIDDLGTVGTVQTLRATDTVDPGSRRFLRLFIGK